MYGYCDGFVLANMHKNVNNELRTAVYPTAGTTRSFIYCPHFRRPTSIVFFAIAVPMHYAVCSMRWHRLLHQLKEIETL